MSHSGALLALSEESAEYPKSFKKLCLEGSSAISGQAWQFADELADRGSGITGDNLEDVEDALFDLAGELLPGSPAARWESEWAPELVRDAGAFLAERYVEGSYLTALNEREEMMATTAERETRTAYRAAVQ